MTLPKCTFWISKVKGNVNFLAVNEISPPISTPDSWIQLYQWKVTLLSCLVYSSHNLKLFNIGNFKLLWESTNKNLNQHGRGYIPVCTNILLHSFTYNTISCWGNLASNEMRGLCTMNWRGWEESYHSLFQGTIPAINRKGWGKLQKSSVWRASAPWDSNSLPSKYKSRLVTAS